MGVLAASSPHCGRDPLCRTSWRGRDGRETASRAAERKARDAEEESEIFIINFLSRRCGARFEHDLLLIGRSQLQVEIVEVVVFFGIEQSEIAGKERAPTSSVPPLATELIRSNARFRPGDFGGLRRALHGVSGGQMIDDIILSPSLGYADRWAWYACPGPRRGAWRGIQRRGQAERFACRSRCRCCR